MDKTDRSEYLQALILLHMMKNEPKRNRMLQLNLAGFSNLEIADLLQTTTTVVAQSLYEARQGNRSEVKKKASGKRSNR